MSIENGEEGATDVDQPFDRLRHTRNSGSREARQDLTHDPCRGSVLAWLLLPTFSGLVNRPLAGVFTPLRCLIALAFGLFIGVCAGAYPAWLAQHALPGPALAGRGNSETAAGLWVRRVLTVLQFSSAMALSATALAVGWQTYFASHASPGFDPAHLLILDLPSDAEGKQAAVAFTERLAAAR